MNKVFNMLDHYNYPSDNQIRLIRKLMDQGITDKWEIEEVVNKPTSNNPIIIDFIETEMQIYKRSKRWK